MDNLRSRFATLHGELSPRGLASPQSHCGVSLTNRRGSCIECTPLWPFSSSLPGISVHSKQLPISATGAEPFKELLTPPLRLSPPYLTSLSTAFVAGKFFDNYPTHPSFPRRFPLLVRRSLNRRTPSPSSTRDQPPLIARTPLNLSLAPTNFTSTPPKILCSPSATS